MGHQNHARALKLQAVSVLYIYIYIYTPAVIQQNQQEMAVVHVLWQYASLLTDVVVLTPSDGILLLTRAAYSIPFVLGANHLAAVQKSWSQLEASLLRIPT